MHVRGSGVALCVTTEAYVCQAGSTDFEVCIATLYAPPPLPGRPFDPKGRPAWLKKPLPLCGTPPWGSAFSLPPRYSMPPKAAAPERLSTASARRRALITDPDPKQRTAVLGGRKEGNIAKNSEGWAVFAHLRQVCGGLRTIPRTDRGGPRKRRPDAHAALPGVPRRRADPARFNLARC